jgi:hypothetical protein
MTAACLLVLSGVVGQFPYGYGYGRTPLPYYDPIRYARFYNGEGYYNYVPPPIANPRVIVPWRSVDSLPGLTGRVLGLNQSRKLITLRLPADTIHVPYGDKTRFRALDGGFPEIAPGMLINVDHGTITVLNRGGRP